jgi:hypothetical protein
MATNEKVRQRIAAIIGKPNSVEYSEILWVLNQLGCPAPRETRHGVIHSIPGCREKLMINKHNNGKSHVPAYCVDDFRDRMVELGLCDETL